MPGSLHHDKIVVKENRYIIQLMGRSARYRSGSVPFPGRTEKGLLNPGNAGFRGRANPAWVPWRFAYLYTFSHGFYGVYKV